MSQASFDIIFAGGGTTACVIAGRLADVDPSLKILIIESGQHSHDDPRHIQPYRYVEHVASGSTTLSSYVSRPSACLNGRKVVASSGHAVGGGSAVNWMLYVRGAASDYDDWATFDNKGWSFDELLPFIRKLETFTPVSNRSSRSTTHGYSGPIKISAHGLRSGIKKQFLDVAREYDPDRPQVDDNNDFTTANAYSSAYHFIDPVTGRRSDAASRYLYPHVGNQSLTIAIGKRVKRIVIENGHAVGVEYTTDGKSGQDDSDALVTVKARKLIVVCAGAFGSPAILERSGIGAPSVLERSNVPVLVDLPGVGENYHDHVSTSPVFYASNETDTMDDIWGDSEEVGSEYTASLKEWEASGTGKIGYNGIEALVKVRPTEAELKFGGPSLQKRWATFFQKKPDKPMALIFPFAGFPLSRLIQCKGKCLFVTYYVLYPESIGSVHITSGDDLNSCPDFDPDFLTKTGDIEQFTLLYKMSRELIRRLPAYRGEVIAFHPQFPAGSPAACKETDLPVPVQAPDIVYSKVDDEAIVKFHRDRAVPTWHALGTCAMKPRDQGGVVDARLNVYGVQGLKVADLSICPSNVGNNTNSTALLIGEKAAAIIAEDLGYDTTV